MAPPTAASPIRVAIIDDDSGLVTVLDRRFARLRWEREVIGYAATPDQLSALRLHALILNPELTGLDYIERIALALPGLALLVCTGTAPVADGRVLEREDIYQWVWGYTMVRGDRSVDVFVRKLRQKLEALSPEWRYVHTHFGVGYRFAAERIDGAPAEQVDRSEAPAQPAE